MCFKLFYPLLVLLLLMNPLGFASEIKRGATNITIVRCIEKERQALLAFKQGLTDNQLLSSWGSNTSTDCCKWKGVYCSKQTGHVTEINLSSEGREDLSLQGKISPELFELQHLEHLDLRFNNFSRTKIPKSIGSLSNLKFLNLYFCHLGGEVPYQLGNLTQLQFLSLDSNYFTNPRNLNWLPDLSSLTSLNLDSMNLSNVLDWPKVVDQLHKLQTLSLSDCDLGGEVPYQLGNLTQLQILDLSFNYFTNPRNLNWLPDLSSLTSLNLDSMNLGNVLDWPKVVDQLHKLQTLSLSDCDLGGEVPYQLGNLTQLQILDLSFNNFTNPRNLNWLPDLSSLTSLNLDMMNLSNVLDWPKVVDQLHKLQTLSLSNCDLFANHLSGSIPDVFSNLRSLVSLDLSSNHLSGSILDVFSNLRSLVSLDLSSNHLSGSIPDVFSNLRSLVSVDLSANDLSGSIPDVFSNLRSLVSLHLSANNLSGSIPDVFSNLSSLEELYLADNSIDGHLPKTFGQLCSLQYLDLSSNNHSGDFSEFIQVLFGCASNSIRSLSLYSNQLTGTIPKRIGSLSNLTHFDVSMNSLTGVITEAHFSELSKLQLLDLSQNSLTLKIRSDWLPPFQLVSIRLRSCKVGPYFPQWLRTSQKSFSDLDLSDAGISDVIPSWLQDTFVNLSHDQEESYRYLNLSSNQLEGPLHSLPSEVASVDLSNNNLTGRISFLCASKGRGMTFLDLSSNSFSGELPDCWNHSENLVNLDLSNNYLSGKVPTSLGSLASLETLKLGKNNIVGDLPSSLKNHTNLTVFDIGENRITGMLPAWIGTSYSKLAILILRSNQFSGSMPLELCHLKDIQLLDLSGNHFSGAIPQCLNNLTTLAQKGNSSPNITHYAETISYRITYVDDASLMWKGRMSEYKSTLGLVKSIDFSSNRLDGEIPRQITDLIGLISLNLSRNYLTGQMPPQIGKLQSLDFLDLSRNYIYGRIPTSLTQIYGLGSLDLSNNNLSGKIPIGTQLQSFDPSTYAQNPQLCGLPLPKICPTEETRSKQVLKEDGDELISYGFYVSMGLGFAVGFWGVCGSLIFNRSWRYTYFGFLDAVRDWLYVRAMLIRRDGIACLRNEWLRLVRH